MKMPYPGLIQEDHKILGNEYCSGYTDVFGKWNTGFYCPQTETTSAVFCCGTSYVKYCCTTTPTHDEENEDLQMGMPTYHVRVPVFFAVFCGILAVVILLITAICFFCSCCFVYKKRRDATSTGLYRIQGSSSTVSALASIYSNQNNSSVVTTPLDSDWTLNTLPISSYPTPYPFSQSITSSASAFSPYPNSNLSPVSSAAGAVESNFSNNNNNNLPNFYYNNLTSRSVNINGGQVPSLYSYGNLNQRPLSALSTLSGSSTNASSSNSTFSYGRQYPRQNSTLLHQQSNAYGFPIANNLPLSQQGYVYRHQQSVGLIRSNTNNIGQAHGASLRSPFSMNQRTNGLQMHGQSHSVQPNPIAYGNGNRTAVQNNTYQQRQNSNSLAYNNGGSSGPGGGNGLIRSTTTPTSNSNRAQGNILNQQQQQLNQIIFAAIQSLIGSYRGSNGGPNALVPPTTTSGSRPNSLSSSDINRLNAINLRLSSLNQNIRSGDNRTNTTTTNTTSSSDNGGRGGGNNENIALPPTITNSDRDDSGKENDAETTTQNEQNVNLLPSSNNADQTAAPSPVLESQSSKVISEEESTENRVSSSLDGEDKKTAIEVEEEEESPVEMRNAVPSCNSKGNGEESCIMEQEKANNEDLGQLEKPVVVVVDSSYGSIEVGIQKEGDGESEPTTSTATTTTNANILEPDTISILVEQCSDHKAEPNSNNVNDSLHQKTKDEGNGKLTVVVTELAEQNQVEEMKKKANVAEIQEFLCDAKPADCE